MAETDFNELWNYSDQMAKSILDQIVEKKIPPFAAMNAVTDVFKSVSYALGLTPQLFEEGCQAVANDYREFYELEQDKKLLNDPKH